METPQSAFTPPPLTPQEVDERELLRESRGYEPHFRRRQETTPPQSPPPRPTTERAEPPRGNPPRANAPPGPGNGCYFCGSPFHFKSHCPQLRAQNSRFQPYPPRSEPPPPGRRPLNITPPTTQPINPPVPVETTGRALTVGAGFGGGTGVENGFLAVLAQLGPKTATFVQLTF
jgi:hypothetical protein